LIDAYLLPLMFAATGANDEALDLLRWNVAHDGGFYSLALLRVSPLASDFMCRAEVQAFYAEIDLPPLPKPLTCP
jgi:hypothetical protein